MFQWISDNIWALFVILVLAGIIAAAVYTVVRDKRKGKASCGCNCAHCAMAGSCHNADLLPTMQITKNNKTVLF